MPTSDDRSAKRRSESMDFGASLGQGGFNQLQGDALNKAFADYKTGIMNSVTAKCGNLTNQSLDVQQGFAAEAHHVGSFNIEAAAKGQLNHRATLDVGKVNDPVADIRVTTPESSHDYQVKFYKDGNASAAALSPKKYDTVGKVVPKDQVASVKKAASKRAAKAEGSRPDVANSNKDTAHKATDRISSEDKHNIQSTPLNRKGEGSAEELAKQAKQKGEGSDYKETVRVRAEFNAMQYRNAAKSGALSGAVFGAAGELYSILGSAEPMTRDRCMEAAQSIVLGSLKGAGRAAAVTGVQHLGQMMADAAAQAATRSAANAAGSAAAKAGASSLSGSIGQQLSKGNVAAATVAVTMSLGENLYRFCNGEIDSIEFASFSIGSTIQIVGTSCATALSAPASALLAQFIASSVSEIAVMGTTLGALGPIALGAVFAIGFSLVVGSLVGHFQNEGSTLAIKDITAAAARLESGHITLTDYAASVGTLSENTFSWTDCIPFTGAISVLAEYSTRRGQLVSIQADIRHRFDQLDMAERRQMEEMMEQFNYQLHAMDLQYEQARRDIVTQTAGKFEQMSASLERHLELNYLLFTPVLRKFQGDADLITSQQYREEQAKLRIQSYQQELEHLTTMVDQALPDSPEDQQLKLQLSGALKQQMEMILPAATGFDQAYEFLLQA